jgi:catechol 2,3-dioxygenase-like lactoylglutathione lyase family enzyme
MEQKLAQYHSAVVFVRDIAAAKCFYIDLLEMEIDLDFGTNVGLKGGLTLWQIDPNHIILRRLGSDSIGDQRINRFELYFETEDLDAAYERVKTSGAEFLHEIHEEPWGQRTMRFFDPDRHLIEIGELLETFIKRLHGENMTPEQVAQKSSVPLSKVREILVEKTDHRPWTIDHGQQSLENG